MPLNTRSNHREPVSSEVDIIFSEAVARTIKMSASRGSASGAASLKAKLLDISLTGCGVQMSYLIPNGVVADIVINPGPLASIAGVEHTEAIKATVKVTSSTMKGPGVYRLGLFFTNIPKENLDLIDLFIKKSLEKAKTPHP